MVSELLKDYRATNPAVGIFLFEQSFQYFKCETELLEALPLKLHLVHVYYKATNEDALKKHLGNNYALHLLSGTCHYPMLERPKEFNTLSEKILHQIENR